MKRNPFLAHQKSLEEFFFPQTFAAIWSAGWILLVSLIAVRIFAIQKSNQLYLCGGIALISTIYIIICHILHKQRTNPQYTTRNYIILSICAAWPILLIAGLIITLVVKFINVEVPLNQYTNNELWTSIDFFMMRAIQTARVLGSCLLAGAGIPCLSAIMKNIKLLRTGRPLHTLTICTVLGLFLFLIAAVSVVPLMKGSGTTFSDLWSMGSNCPTCVGLLLPIFIASPILLFPWLIFLISVVGVLATSVSLIVRFGLHHRNKHKIANSPTKPTPPVLSKQITPLLEAIIGKDITAVRSALAEHPEHLNAAYAQNGNTPLHVAALNGYTEIVRLLLEQPGIDKTRKNKDGKTALDLAQEKNFTEIAELLK